MKYSQARAFPYASKDAPRVLNPVVATPDVATYYYDGEMHKDKGINCSKIFAATVLRTMEEWALKYGYDGLLHIGVFNSRYARHPDQTPILPIRWSNHAYGAAMDFKGIYIESGDSKQIMTVDQMLDGIPAKTEELIAQCATAIKKAGRKPEIVREPTAQNCSWLHIGIRPV